MKTTGNIPKNKREEKKQVNIKWNSRLFFQIGIIISVLIVFFVMETSFKTELSRPYNDTSRNFEEPPMIDYVVELDIPIPVEPIKKSPVKPAPQPVPTKTVQANTIAVIDNTSVDIESDIPSTDLPAVVPTAPSVSVVVEPEPSAPRSIINVEHVPVYPGCEGLGSNAEKIECMSAKINTFINRNFRKELLESLERNEVQKIYVQFRIDSQGFIKDVRANSHNERLKAEAQRVVGNLPEMRPGKQGDKNVDVLYTVPIIFKIQ